jgi:hypothetical protein
LFLPHYFVQEYVSCREENEGRKKCQKFEIHPDALPWKDEPDLIALASALFLEAYAAEDENAMEHPWLPDGHDAATGTWDDAVEKDELLWFRTLYLEALARHLKALATRWLRLKCCSRRFWFRVQDNG